MCIAPLQKRIPKMGIPQMIHKYKVEITRRAKYSTGGIIIVTTDNRTVPNPVNDKMIAKNANNIEATFRLFASVYGTVISKFSLFTTLSRRNFNRLS